MRPLLIGVLSLFAVFGASAQTVDPHAGHHQDKLESAEAPATAQPDHHCPMMKEGQHAMPAGTMPPDHMMADDAMERCGAMHAPDHVKGEKK